MATSQATQADDDAAAAVANSDGLPAGERLSLEEMTRIMDVATTLRKERAIVDQQLNIDQIKANVAGWRTTTFKDLPFFHHRPEGSRDGTSLSARLNQGRASHYMGYRSSYLLLRTLFALRTGPSALGLVLGYSLEAGSRRPRCADPDVRRYVQSQQSLALWRQRVREARGLR